MEINLPLLRAEALHQPLLPSLLEACTRIRSRDVTTLDLVREHLGRERTLAFFQETVLAFRLLESAGLGRLLQPQQRARARFRWAISPLTIQSALLHEPLRLTPADLLPAAAELGLTLPAADPEPSGWTRHRLTLRPKEHAELLVPDDLTPREAAWLADYLLRLATPEPPAAKVPSPALAPPPGPGK